METSKKDPKRTLKGEPTFAQKAAAQFKEAEAELRAFMEDPGTLELLQQYHTLVQARNEKLTAAVQAAKSELSRSSKDKMQFESIGVLKKHKLTYDVNFLREHLPAEQAALIITERTVYELNTEELTRLVRQEEIDKAVVQQACTDQSALSIVPGTPKVWELPPLSLE